MKNKITCILSGAVVLTFSLLAIFLPKATFSESERRVLATAPEFSAESVFSGEFASAFETYSTDTFPFRDAFRRIKAYTSGYAFNLSDNNGLFLQSGHLSKVDYPLNTHMLDHAASRFRFVYDTHIKGKSASVYHAIIPDKNYYLDTLKYDYSALSRHMCESLPEFRYIDLSDCLTLSDFYTTDSHWRQEKLGKVVGRLGGAMGINVDSKYEQNALDRPFYGVYVGQSALDVPPDTIKYLTSDTLDGCTVMRANDNTGILEEISMYDTEKAEGRDAYEMFLSGNSAVVTILNPDSDGGRLIVFRDSFGSSLVPLLVPAYSEICVFDLRYISPAALGAYTTFENADVLFIHNTTLLNSSLGIK